MQETQVPSLIREDSHMWLGLRATTIEPVLRAPGATTRGRMPQLLKPLQPTACALQQEKSLQWEAQALQLESSPGSPQLEKSLSGSEDPARPKIK